MRCTTQAESDWCAWLETPLTPQLEAVLCDFLKPLTLHVKDKTYFSHEF